MGYEESRALRYFFITQQPSKDVYQSPEDVISHEVVLPVFVIHVEATASNVILSTPTEAGGINSKIHSLETKQ